MNTLGAGEGGMNWESSNDIYALPYVKQIANRKVPYNTGAQSGALSQSSPLG